MWIYKYIIYFLRFILCFVCSKHSKFFLWNNFFLKRLLYIYIFTKKKATLFFLSVFIINSDKIYVSFMKLYEWMMREEVQVRDVIIQQFLPLIFTKKNIKNIFDNFVNLEYIRNRLIVVIITIYISDNNENEHKRADLFDYIAHVQREGQLAHNCVAHHEVHGARGGQVRGGGRGR